MRVEGKELEWKESKQKTTDDGNLCFNNYKEGNSRDTTLNLPISRR